MSAEEGSSIPLPSPFLDPLPRSTASTLGIIHLKRDLLVPTVLQPPSASAEYAEGTVTNTRFGSFPHTTLLDVPWGSQIRASKVDTGSRGNKSGGRNKKRKRENNQDGGEGGEGENGAVAEAIVADTGFAHLLPPTPETWTVSLPHRTQVVYTPDYSYVLQRLKIRPGDSIIEAGAGSGSFSHAAARAVFSGYPWEDENPASLKQGKKGKRRLGKVFSFEYHEPRAAKLRQEIKDHRLDTIIHLTHRDVYQDGFCLEDGEDGVQRPQADAIFLDLPAPWMALKHLTRKKLLPDSISSEFSEPSSNTGGEAIQPQQSSTLTASFVSPLNPKTTVRICTFSPCIEQVTKTVFALREYGWTEIDMVEISQKRLEVRRERIGIHEDGNRNSNIAPANVEEAIAKARELEERHKAHREMSKDEHRAAKKAKASQQRAQGKSQAESAEPKESRKLFKEGRLTHRTENELKTHTSYLVFAILPREWTAEDEARCMRRWPLSNNPEPAEPKPRWRT